MSLMDDIKGVERAIAQAQQQLADPDYNRRQHEALSQRAQDMYRQRVLEQQLAEQQQQQQSIQQLNAMPFAPTQDIPVVEPNPVEEDVSLAQRAFDIAAAPFRLAATVSEGAKNFDEATEVGFAGGGQWLADIENADTRNTARSLYRGYLDGGGEAIVGVPHNTNFLGSASVDDEAFASLYSKTIDALRKGEISFRDNDSIPFKGRFLSANSARVLDAMQRYAKGERNQVLQPETIKNRDFYDSMQGWRHDAQSRMAVNPHERGTAEYYAFAFGDSGARMLPALAVGFTTRNPGLAAGIMATPIATTAYGEAVDKGLDTETASAYALLTGASEFIPGKIVIGSILNQTGRGIAANALKGLVKEGTEEMITETLQMGLDYGFLDERVTLKEALLNIRDAFVLGGAMGTTMGGVQGAINNMIIPKESAEGDVQERLSLLRRIGHLRKQQDAQNAEMTNVEEQSQQIATPQTTDGIFADLIDSTAAGRISNEQLNAIEAQDQDLANVIAQTQATLNSADTPADMRPMLEAQLQNHIGQAQQLGYIDSRANETTQSTELLSDTQLIDLADKDQNLANQIESNQRVLANPEATAAEKETAQADWNAAIDMAKRNNLLENKIADSIDPELMPRYKLTKHQLQSIAKSDKTMASSMEKAQRIIGRKAASREMKIKAVEQLNNLAENAVLRGYLPAKEREPVNTALPPQDPIDNPPSARNLLGRRTSVTVGDDTLKSRFRIMEADDLPRTDLSQEKAAKAEQISDSLMPEWLDASSSGFWGSPVINERGKISRGSVRLNAVRQAYQKGKADKYKKHLIKNAESYGVNAKVVAQMSKPVLVRETDIHIPDTTSHVQVVEGEYIGKQPDYFSTLLATRKTGKTREEILIEFGLWSKTWGDNITKATLDFSETASAVRQRLNNSEPLHEYDRENLLDKSNRLEALSEAGYRAAETAAKNDMLTPTQGNFFGRHIVKARQEVRQYSRMLDYLKDNQQAIEDKRFVEIYDAKKPPVDPENLDNEITYTPIYTDKDGYIDDTPDEGIESRFSFGVGIDTEISEVGKEIKSLFYQAVNGELSGKPVAVGRLTQQGKAFLEELSGLSFKTNIDFVLNPSDLNHIYRDHYGANEKDKGNNIPLNDSDIEMMASVIYQPDAVVFIGYDKKTQSNKFQFLKETDKGAYNLVEVYGNKRGNLTAKTYYHTKRGVAQRVMDANKSLLPTSETYFGTYPNANVPVLFEKINAEPNNLEDTQIRTDLEKQLTKKAADKVVIDRTGKSAGKHSEDAKGAEGWYTKGDKVYINPDNIEPLYDKKGREILSKSERIAFVAWHELGHRGVYANRLWTQFENNLKKASNNPFVSQLAQAFQADRAKRGMPIDEVTAVEEALVEINATMNSGKMDALTAKWGVTAPFNKNGVAPFYRRLVELLRQVVGYIKGKPKAQGSNQLSNAQLLELLQTITDGATAPIKASGKGTQFSQSPMKSTQANIKRGREAMNKALTEKTSVHRAMYRNDTGWIDFVWGDVGKVKANGKTKGGKGLSHIIESRMRKDAMTYDDMTEMLTERVVDTIAKGQVTNSFELSNSQRIDIENNGNRVSLIKNKGSNSWVITSFDLFESKGVGGENEIGSVDTSNSTQSKPTLTRQGLGAPTATDNTSLNEDLTQDDSGDIQFSLPPTNAELDAQIADTVKRYGGEKAYNKAKADGKTKLHYRQWIQVRMPAFKRWFGDWEAVNNRQFLDGEAVATMQGDEVPTMQKVVEVVNWAKDYYAPEKGTYQNPELGNIHINRRSVKDSLSHGVSDRKVQGLWLLPKAIPKMKVLEHLGEKNGQFGFVLAAPVEMGGERYILSALIRGDSKAKRMYVHEMDLEKTLQVPSTDASAETGELNSGQLGAMNSVLQKTYAVNDVSKVTDPDTGEPMVVYHAANSEFSIFERKGYNHKGHFFSDNADVAKQYGSHLMPVFLNVSDMTEIDGNSQSFNAAYDNIPDFEYELNNIGRWSGGIKIASIYDHPSGLRKGKRSDVYAVADANQIKSAVSNDGSFSPDNDDIRFSLASGANDLLQRGFADDGDSLKDNVIRKMANKFLPIKRLQEAIERNDGKLSLDNDVYLAEERYQGKIGNDAEIMERRYVKPLADTLAEYNLTQDEFDSFLIARHAEERNIEIAKRNDKYPDGGSGMKTAEAKKILADFGKDPRRVGLLKAAQIVDEMTTRRLQIATSAGLIDEDMAATWRSNYQYYVPLKGVAKDSPAAKSGRNIGKGFNIGGKESKIALGRSSMAQSPSSQVVIDLSDTLVRARKNEVGQHFKRLVEENPDPELWQIFTRENPDRYTVANTSGGEITANNNAAVPMHMMPDKYLAVKGNGKQYYIKVNNKEIMNAMNNLSPEMSNGFLRVMAGFNRYLSAINTAYSPEFVISNFSRDIQTAYLNLNAEATRDDGKIKGENIANKVMKDLGKASKAIYHAEYDKDVDGDRAKWKQYYQEFKADGAKTGFVSAKDIDQQQKHIRNLIERQDGTVKSRVIRGGQAVAEIVDFANNNVENMTRLSAYVNAREAGFDRRLAASLAKNMTVNFNRRGELGTVLSAMYLFANASIQGTLNFTRTMVGLKGDGKLRWRNLNRAQKIATFMMGASYTLALFNRAMAGEDDDGESYYDKIPDWVKERNIVIMKGDGKGGYWKIPLPYGYNIFSVAGTTIESVQAGKTSIGGGAWGLTKAFAGSFSPIPLSDSDDALTFAAKNATPTLFKWVTEIGYNENHFGGTIYNENDPYGVKRPDAMLGRNATSEIYKQAATWLNDFTGGDAYTSGWWDWHPETFKHLVSTFTGGMGTFWSTKVVGSGTNLAAGVELDWNDVPFLSKVNGEYTPYEDQDKYYERRNRIRQLALQAKEVGTGEMSEIDKKKVKFINAVKAVDKELKKLRKVRNNVYADSRLSVKQRSEAIKNIEKRIAYVIDRFNGAYNDKVGVRE